MPHPKTCIFCDGSPLTREHMYADWLKRYIPRSMERHSLASAIDFPHRRETAVQSRTGDPHSRRIKCVCFECNSGWMSRLQEATKPFLVPMLTGGETILYKRGKTNLASWAAMMVMCAEYIDPKKIAVPQADRAWLRAKGFPPSHWRIWIGCGDRKRQSQMYRHNVLTISKEEIEFVDRDFVPEPNTQTTTICLGEQVVIHAMSSVTGRALIRRWKPPLHVAPRIRQIWPLADPAVTWPTPGAMNDDDIFDLSDAFYEQSVRVSLLPEG